MEAHPHQHGPHPSSAGDLWGQALSLLCLVHCVATPLVVMVVPAMADFLGAWHPVLLAGVTATAAWAFVPGYRYHHNKVVLALAAGGVLLLGVAISVFHENFVAETVVTMAGAALMLGAHLKNRQLSKRCLH